VIFFSSLFLVRKSCLLPSSTFSPSASIAQRSFCILHCNFRFFRNFSFLPPMEVELPHESLPLESKFGSYLSFDVGCLFFFFFNHRFENGVCPVCPTMQIDLHNSCPSVSFRSKQHRLFLLPLTSFESPPSPARSMPVLEARFFSFLLLRCRNFFPAYPSTD